MNNAISLYDEEKYDKAIEECRIAQRYNKDSIAPQFEIAKCNIRLGRLEWAKTILRSLAPHIGGKLVSRHYYELWGYIAGEEEKYDVALACNKLCQRIKWRVNGFMEILWIKSHGNVKVSFREIIPILKKNDIPVIFQLQWKR